MLVVWFLWGCAPKSDLALQVAALQAENAELRSHLAELEHRSCGDPEDPVGAP